MLRQSPCISGMPGWPYSGDNQSARGINGIASWRGRSAAYSAGKETNAAGYGEGKNMRILLIVLMLTQVCTAAVIQP